MTWSKEGAATLGLCALYAMIGCGSEVVVQGPGGDDDTPPVAVGGGAPMPSTGPGGTGAGPTTSTGGGGSSMKLCGSGQPPCPPSEYCDLPGDSCSGQGTCLKRPEGCPEDCPGVCGCDGQPYCNTCLAQSQGVDVGDLACNQDTEYVAEAWPGGLDHIIVKKADFAADTCVWLMVDAPTMGQLGISAPAPWGVNSATAFPGAASCFDVNPPMSQTASASGGMGAVTWTTSTFYPCSLSIDAVLQFPAQPWLAPSQVLASMDIPVDGGCF